jgi:catalase
VCAAQEFIQKRVIANFSAADPDYGARIARKVAALKSKGESSSYPPPATFRILA